MAGSDLGYTVSRNAQAFQIGQQCLTVVVVDGSIRIRLSAIIQICGIGRNIGDTVFILQHPKVFVILIGFTDVLNTDGTNRTIYIIGRARHNQNLVTRGAVIYISIPIVIGNDCIIVL